MSKIAWCDITINPVVGCSKCSVGCVHCYAEKFAARLAKNKASAAKYAGTVKADGKWSGKLNFEGWGCLDSLPKSPRRIFLGSMTDTFHENMTLQDFHDLADYMEFRWPQHTFLLLTKRPANARRILAERPLPQNVWLGVTVCNQDEAEIKIPILLEIPASVHFVSAEPLLDYLKLEGWLTAKKLDWVISGGETGANARPIHPDWIRNLRDQCLKTGIPFFFKSWGDYLPCSQIDENFDVKKYPVGDIGNDGLFIPPPCLEIPLRNGVTTEQIFKVGKKLSGFLIDGMEYRQFPEVRNA